MLRALLRVLLPLIALGALWWSVLWPVEKITTERGFRHALAEPIGVMNCDLSKPGTASCGVSIDYPYGHGLKLIVDGPAKTHPADYGSELWLNGLRGSAVVIGGSPYAEEPRPLMGDLSFASGPDSAAIVRLYPGVRDAACTVKLDIERGAPALAGVSHRVLILNDVCGCELIGVRLMLMTLVISVPVALGCAYGTYRVWRT